MFYLIWQIGFFLLLAFALGLFTGWMSWGSAGQQNEAREALDEVARLRGENENLARRLGEAEARGVEAEQAPEAIKTGAAAMPELTSAAKKAEPVAKPVAETQSKPKAVAQPKAAAKPKAATKPKAKTGSKPAAKPAPKAKPKAKAADEPADDLTQIKGLGPKAAASLNGGGVTRYAQIAAWTKADIADWDARINGRGRIERDDWVGQAKRLK